MADFLDFQEITEVANLSGSSKIVGIKSDDSAEQQFSVDLLIDKVEGGLGDSATKDVGTIAGTVAAGDHNHTGVYAPVLGSDDNYATDAEKTKLGNLSGTNTGDQNLSGYVPVPSIITESTTSRTLALTDAHNFIHATHSSGCSITVPPQGSVAWPDGTIIYGDQGAAGAVTIIAGSGVTVSCADTLVTDGQHSAFALVRISSNVWLLTGRLVAA